MYFFNCLSIYLYKKKKKLIILNQNILNGLIIFCLVDNFNLSEIHFKKCIFLFYYEENSF